MNRSIVTITSKEHSYKLAQMVGQGQFGKVYKAYCDNTNNPVAIKMIRRNKFIKNDKLKHLLQRQMEVLTGFQHPNVIRFHQLIVQNQDVYLVYQYCQGGTLEEQITIKQEDLLPLFEQIVSAMVQAQKRGFLHRDIKPANILFKNGNIKIADWGFSRLLESGQTACSFIGSPAYMAPQILKGSEYTSKADVWSLGVLLYQTLTGTCPWRSSSINTLYTEIARKSLKFPKDVLISSRLKIIISSMLSLLPEKRPTFLQLSQKLQSCSSPPRMCRSELMIKKSYQQDIKQQKKIAGCVFFLEMIQWCRKQVMSNITLLAFVQLIEKNLNKLKPQEYQEQIYLVWKKQIKVVKQIKAKIEKKINIQSPRLRFFSSGKENQDLEWQLNPEGQWQSLAKSTIKMVIQLLENGYKEIKQVQNQKQRLLNQINLLLDLILFPDIPDQYLNNSFEKYIQELKSYSNKTLLKLINRKLIVINKKYYN